MDNGNIFALFIDKQTNKRVAIKQTMLGGFYIDRLDYDGLMLAGATKEINHITLEFLSNPLDYEIVKSPDSLYHVWHICLCENCIKNGGKYFDHSQGSFNDHLRYVSNDDLFTFKTVML